MFPQSVKEQIVRSDGEFTPLGLAMAGNRLLSAIGGPAVDTLERAVCDSGRFVVGDDSALGESVRLLYYHAKNVVFAHPQLSHEMLNVQGHMNFSSESAGASLVLLIAFVVVGIRVHVLGATA